MLDRLRQALLRQLKAITAQPPDPSKVEPDSVEVEHLRAQGNALIAAGQLSRAEAYFRDALDIKSNDTGLYRDRERLNGITT